MEKVLRSSICARNLFITTSKAVLRIRIRSDPVFFGHPDWDPDPGKYRIRIRIRENAESRSGKIPDLDPDPLSTKRPHVIQIFLL